MQAANSIWRRQIKSNLLSCWRVQVANLLSYWNDAHNRSLVTYILKGFVISK